jgi:hypothetical protein
MAFVNNDKEKQNTNSTSLQEDIKPVSCKNTNTPLAETICFFAEQFCKAHAWRTLTNFSCGTHWHALCSSDTLTKSVHLSTHMFSSRNTSRPWLALGELVGPEMKRKTDILSLSLSWQSWEKQKNKLPFSLGQDCEKGVRKPPRYSTTNYSLANRSLHLKLLCQLHRMYTSRCYDYDS